MRTGLAGLFCGRAPGMVWLSYNPSPRAAEEEDEDHDHWIFYLSWGESMWFGRSHGWYDGPMCIWNAGPIQLLVRETTCKRCRPMALEELKKVLRLLRAPGKLSRREWEALESAYGWLGARIERAKSRIGRWLPSGGVGIELSGDRRGDSDELALVLDVEGRRGSAFVSRDFWITMGEQAGWSDEDLDGN